MAVWTAATGWLFATRVLGGAGASGGVTLGTGRGAGRAGGNGGAGRLGVAW